MYYSMIFYLLTVFGITCSKMDSKSFKTLSISKDFKWLNEPQKWTINENNLEVTTDNGGDFWQGTWYGFHHNTGHVYGVEIKDNFTFTACIEADFSELYDQAGLMIYQDEKFWLKAGIEYNDGQPMIGSVLTNQFSDWATGVFTGNPRKFYLRLTRKDDVVCVKYSTDNVSWTLLRLSPFVAGTVFVGPMTCTPKRAGLEVKFSEITIGEPPEDILHSN